MFRILAASVLALSLAAGATGPAAAQSYNAPAGIPAVTAPGGLPGAGAFHRARDARSNALPADADLATGSLPRTRTAR